MMKFFTRELCIRVALVLVSALVSFVVLEFFLRLTPLTRLMPYGGTPAYYYQSDRDLGYGIAPNFASTTASFRADGLQTSSYTLWSNELGCFDTPYQGERPYKLLLGDSFTWGYVNLQDNWGSVLEKNIGERVLKCGVAGYGTQQELIKAERLLKKLKAPSEILLAYNANDVADDANMPNRFVYKGLLIPNFGGLTDYDAIQKELPTIFYNSGHYCMWNTPEHPTMQRIKCFLHMNSITYLVVTSRIKDILPFALLNKIGLVNTQPSDEVPAPVAADKQSNFAHIRTLSDLAQHYGAKFTVVFMTTADMLLPNTPDPYADVKAYLDQEGIAYIDPRKPIQDLTQKGVSLYWPSNLHWNVPGNRLAGLLVSEAMLQKVYTQADTKRLETVKAALRKEFAFPG